MKLSRTDTGVVLVVIAWWLLITVLIATVIVAGWHYITTDTAVYELETGEYLHCTPQGGNELKCEVTHR